MNNLIYKITLRCWFVLLAVALPMVSFAQNNENTGNVDNAESEAMARTKQNAITYQETDPNGANYLGYRRALVGKHCSVNRVINVVAVGSGTSGLENLTNEDLSDDATFPSVIDATVATSPTVSIRDMKYYYAAGTTAGFCLVASSGSSVLSLDLVKTYHIWFYCDGQRVADMQVDEGSNGSGVKLSLIGIPGSDQACINLTAKSNAKFDEVALVQVGAVDASVGSEIKIKYAFVGDAHDIYMTTNGIANYCAENNISTTYNVSCEAFMPSPLVGGIPIPMTGGSEGKVIDDDLTNTVALVSAVQLASVAFKGRVRINVENSDASVGELFHEGDQVGFKYNFVQVADVLQLGVWVDIKLYDHNGNDVQTTTISAEALALSIASGGDQTAYIVAENDFSGAEITFYTALGVLNLGSGFGVYYGFVRPKAVVDHECVINPTADTNLCNSQSSIQLKSNPEVNVTWSVESQPAENGGACSVTDDGFVTGMYADGEYKFRATAEDGVCYDIVTVNHGTSADFVEESPEHIFYTPEYELSFDLHGQTSANLLSISNLTNSEYVLDGDITNYATYTAGLQLAGANGVLLGIKKSDGYIFDGSLANSADEVQVGFVVEMEQTAIGLDLLNTFQIRCFDENGNNLYQSLVQDAGVLGLGLIGNNDKSNLMRMSINVPKINGDGNPVKINEIQLWKVGVLDLDVDDVKFYYGFWADPNDKRNNVVRDGATVVTYDNMGAIVNLGTQADVASVGCVTNNLSNIIDIDDELETYALVQKTVSSGSQEIIVKLGRTLDYRHQVGVVINKDIVALSVNLANVVRIGTYYNGQDTGETSTSWDVLGANVIQGDDKVVLYLQPTTPYDEIHITLGGGLQANQTMKIYGVLLRNDIDNDGTPDVRDTESCVDGILNIQATKVCQGETITITGIGTTETSYKISLPDQDVNKAAITSAQDGTVTYSVTATEAGRFSVYFYDATDNLIGTADYTVYPTQTTWRTTTNNKEWNNWNNWTNGSPYLCTDVIMPSDARTYPSLDETVIKGDEFGCDRIFFESRAAIEKVFKLNYTQAWVNVELQPNRYYMLTAPLQDMYTGDMFIPTSETLTATDGYPFVEITGSNYTAHRTAPRIYQRLWEKAAQNKLGNGNYGTAGIVTETRWSKRFNHLSYEYGRGEGFSLWVDPETNAAESFTFRFPKQQTAYNYFNEMTGEAIPSMEETGLTRENSHRFAYEQGLTPVNYTYKTDNDRMRFDGNSSFTVTVSADASTTTFLVGNPFMSHIDVAAFLEGNSGIASVQAYNGNTTTSAVAVSGSYITTDASFTTIEPMEAFFVTVNSAATSLNVTFTENMFSRDVIEDEGDAKAALPMLAITAKAGGLKARTLLVESEEAVHAETLFDDEALPKLAIFTLSDSQAMDIQSLNDETFIPLGLYMNDSEEVTFSFEAMGDFDKTRYQLYDRETGRTYSLDEMPEITVSGTCLNRFYLVDGNVTSIDETLFSSKKDGVYVTTDGNVITVHSNSADIESVEVFSFDGKKIASVAAPSATRSLNVVTELNIGMVRVNRKGQAAIGRKFIK